MGLQLFPTRRIASTFRLPLIQHPGERVTDQLQRSMMTRDSLRRIKTTSNGTALGPLPAVQIFAQAGPGWANSPESMASGLRARNAGRIVNTTRGQSAGP